MDRILIPPTGKNHSIVCDPARWTRGPQPGELAAPRRQLLRAARLPHEAAEVAALREQGVRHVAELGRQAPRTKARRDPPPETPEKPRYARAAIARVQEAHGDLLSPAGEKPELDKGSRAKLEALLKEFVLLKGELRLAREGLRA